MVFRNEFRSEAIFRNPIANDILLIEDSVALSSLLKARLEEEAGARVTRCATLASAKLELAKRRFTLALTGLNLPDGPNGEAVSLLAEHHVPTIVFTATFDQDASIHYAEKKIIDYIVKDGNRTVDKVVKTVDRILSNGEFSVLVVDDARSARSNLVEILERQNFRVLEAHSGRQALEILEGDESLDLVITDYHMPDMDGYELTRRIRETRNSEQLRVVGISSSTDRLLSASFLKAGACDFIYRPFVPEELQCRIDNNIETLKQLRRLRHMAERDFLTGLANRRHFFESMRNVMASRTVGAVALIDIDHFKSVNDNYGHDAGDKVLVELARIIREFCHSGRHVAARLGGEEFALYLRNTDAFQAHSFCETLRRSVEEAVIPITGHDISITISAGVVELEHGESIDNNLNAADQLLYLAKTTGRNRVYSDLTIPEAMRATADGTV